MIDMTASEPSPPVREDSSDWDSRSHVHALVMMAATVVGLYLCYRMAAPFVPALAWALALAILLAPLQRRLEPKLRSPGLAAGVLVLLVGVVLVLPAMLVADHLIDEAYRGADALTAINTIREQRDLADRGMRRADVRCRRCSEVLRVPMPCWAA